MPLTVQDSATEAMAISNRLKRFARRGMANTPVGTETVSNLAAKTASAAIHQLQLEKAAAILKRAFNWNPWERPALGQSNVAAQYGAPAAARAQRIEQAGANTPAPTATPPAPATTPTRQPPTTNRAMAAATTNWGDAH